jgi:hypothetical protein
MRPHDKERQTESGLKTYEQPRLEVYGDLRVITRQISNTGTLDNGTHLYHNTGG